MRRWYGVYTRPAEASNPSGGYCCQTYWGLFLRQQLEGGEKVADEKEVVEGGQVGDSKRMDRGKGEGEGG